MFMNCRMTPGVAYAQNAVRVDIIHNINIFSFIPCKMRA